MKSRVLYRWFVVLAVGVVVFALPMTALAADDGGGGTGNGAEISIPGIFSILLGSGGTTEGGALALGPMQFDLASLNSTAKIEGLTLGNGEFDWNAVTVTQNQPVGSPAMMVSDAKATVGGPSSGYSSTATAHLTLQPNPAVQGEATVGIAYDGLARQMGVMVGNGNLTANTAPVGVEIQNFNTGAGTMAADEIRLTTAATGGSVNVSGFQTGSSGMSWDAVTVMQPKVQLGSAGTLSDLTLIVHGPIEGYATEGAVTVEINAGDLGSVQAEIGMMYDPSSGQFLAALTNGSASLTTDAFAVQLSGISYMGSTLSIDTVDIALPKLRIEGQISGVTVGGGGAVEFQQAWIRYLPDPQAGGSFGWVQFTVQKVDGSYLIGTQALVTPVAQK
jgi:hypothetical protein